MVPECGGEGEVDFFEAAVGNLLYGFGDCSGEWRGKGRHVPFEPAKWAGHNDFVEADDLVGGCCDIYGGGFVGFEVSRNRGDFGREPKISFRKGGFRDFIQYGFVGAGQKEVFCDASILTQFANRLRLDSITPLNALF